MYKMRRFQQQLSHKECIDILKRGSSGVLALCDHETYPYAVPLSYVYHENKIYMHCALTGHKIDCITQNSNISFCVIDQDQVVPSELTTYFKSVIVFGSAKMIDKDEDKRIALTLLCDKYCEDNIQQVEAIHNALKRVAIIEIDIDHMSGKAAKELV